MQNNILEQTNVAPLRVDYMEQAAQVKRPSVWWENFLK